MWGSTVAISIDGCTHPPLIGSNPDQNRLRPQKASASGTPNHFDLFRFGSELSTTSIMCTMHSAWVGTSAPLSRRSTFANVSHAVKRPRVLRVALPSARRACPSTHAAPRAALAPIDEPLGPAHGSRFSISRWGEGIRGDIRRRGPLYLKDWMDGFSPKAIPTILFLYCACLAPVVAFGGVTSALTGGSMGVVEMLLSSGATGMIYAVGSGQPLTFIAPTGLTLGAWNFIFRLRFRAMIVLV